MPTLQEYAQLSNDARNRADDFLFLDFTPEDIQKRVGGDGSSLQAGEVMNSYLAAKQTNSAWANITDHSREDGIKPVGLGGTTCPSKVAKIKADAGVSRRSRPGMQVAPAIPTNWRNQFLCLIAANDFHERTAA